MIKTLFQLFLAFAKIGFTSFGGTSMIPLIMEEMLSHNWMTADDVANIVAIAEMTPGSLGITCASFAGTQTAGVLGGTAAVIGVLTPTLTLTLVAALFFQKFRESKVMLYIMRAVKPICVGMIFAVLITLSGSTYFAEGISWAGLGIGLLCFWQGHRHRGGAGAGLFWSAVRTVAQNGKIVYTILERNFTPERGLFYDDSRNYHHSGPGHPVWAGRGLDLQAGRLERGGLRRQLCLLPPPRRL